MAAEHVDLWSWVWDVLKTVGTSIVATISFIYGWITKQFSAVDKRHKEFVEEMERMESALRERIHRLSNEHVTTKLEVARLYERDKAKDEKLEEIRESIRALREETAGQTKLLVAIASKQGGGHG